MLKASFGEQTMGSGAMAVEDTKSSGHPPMSKTKRMIKLAIEKGRISCEDVTMFRIPSGSVQRILNGHLNMCHTSTKFKPHAGSLCSICA